MPFTYNVYSVYLYIYVFMVHYMHAKWLAVAQHVCVGWWGRGVWKWGGRGAKREKEYKYSGIFNVKGRKASYGLIAVGAVGVRVPLYLGHS